MIQIFKETTMVMYVFRAETEEGEKIMRTLKSLSNRKLEISPNTIFIFNGVGTFIFREERVGNLIMSPYSVPEQLMKKIIARATIMENLSSAIRAVSKTQPRKPLNFQLQGSIFE